MKPLFKPIGETGLEVPPLGFGAFKIGRNQGIKYARSYELPDGKQVASLLSGLWQLGCSYFDTAPAYGLSEARLGDVLTELAPSAVISTKVGERFENGISTFDYSLAAVELSLRLSQERLQRDVLDLVFIHSNGDDLQILRHTAVVRVLQTWRERGQLRAIGFSGKTVAGAAAACEWADALMVEYHQNDQSHASVIQQAGEAGIAVIVKKGLASGQLPPQTAIPFILKNPAVTSLVVGGLNLSHFKDNWHTAIACRSS